MHTNMTIETKIEKSRKSIWLQDITKTQFSANIFENISYEISHYHEGK